MTGLEVEFRVSRLDDRILFLFQHLNTLKWANTRCGVANLPVNRHKNRIGPVQVLPYDNNRVILRNITGGDGSDYINASLVDGYRERYAYLVTQAVLENTVIDFWRMVWEHDCGIVVMLNSPYDLDRVRYPFVLFIRRYSGRLLRVLAVREWTAARASDCGAHCGVQDDPVQLERVSTVRHHQRHVQNSSTVPVHRVARAGCPEEYREFHRLHPTGLILSLLLNLSPSGS